MDNEVLTNIHVCNKVIDIVIINGVKYIQYERPNGETYWVNTMNI